MNPEPRIPTLMTIRLSSFQDRPSDASFSCEARIARLTSVSGGQGVAVELDLDAERTSKAAFLHGIEHRFEIDVALADRGKIPDSSFTALVLQMAMDQFRQRNLQIGDGIDA